MKPVIIIAIAFLLIPVGMMYFGIPAIIIMRIRK